MKYLGIFSYFAYGLGIHSTLPLPEFLSARGIGDVLIRWDSEARIPSEIPNSRHYLKVDPEESILFDRNVGTFVIRNGCEIVVIPLTNAEDSRIRLYLVGTVMAILLYQRGLLVLHSSAVEVNGEAVAFLGQSGWGKSSIAAALHAKGHRIIADDVVPVSIGADSMTIFPGFPQLKLSAEVAATLGYDSESLLLLHPELGKRGFRVAPDSSTGALPLKGIYVIAQDTTEAIAPLSAQEAVIELVRHSIPTRWLGSSNPAHFLQCTSLAKTIPIYRLQRSDSLSRLPNLAELVEKHLSHEFQAFTKIST